MRTAKLRDPTVSAASTETVIAGPRAIRKVEMTPIQNTPMLSAKTSMVTAPEHGRRPTAAAIQTALRQDNLPSS